MVCRILSGACERTKIARRRRTLLLLPPIRPTMPAVHPFSSPRFPCNEFRGPSRISADHTKSSSLAADMGEVLPQAASHAPGARYACWNAAGSFSRENFPTPKRRAWRNFKSADRFTVLVRAPGFTNSMSTKRSPFSKDAASGARRSSMPTFHYARTNVSSRICAGPKNCARTSTMAWRPVIPVPKPCSNHEPIRQTDRSSRKYRIYALAPSTSAKNAI